MKKIKYILILYLAIFLVFPCHVDAKILENKNTNLIAIEKSPENTSDKNQENSAKENTSGKNQENSTDESSKEHNDISSIEEYASPSPINFCEKTAVIWQIVGWVLLVFKILIPILLIIFGMKDLATAVVGSKEDDIKKATQSLMNRAIAAIVIFFIPTIVGVIMSIIADFRTSGAKSDYKYCQTCLLDPKNCDTSNDASKQ